MLIIFMSFAKAQIRANHQVQYIKFMKENMHVKGN
jgi:hypothetical protein